MEILSSFNLDNLSFIIKRINVSIKENPEEYIRLLFISLGYEVEKLRLPAGIPDFKVWNEKEEFYVEVKGNDDGLRINQIEWIKNNPNKKVVVFYIYQNDVSERNKEEEDLIIKNKMLLDLDSI